MTYDFGQQTLFLLLYGFLAWVAEVVFFSIREKRFVNRGLLTLPIDYEIGAVFSNIITVLPTMGRNYAGMYLITLANVIILRGILGFFGGRLTKNAYWMERSSLRTGRRFLQDSFTAAAILLIYLIVNPLLMSLPDLLSPLFLTILSWAFWIILLADLFVVILAMRKGRQQYDAVMSSGQARHISAQISNLVWRRLERSYPGIRNQETREQVVFAKGMNLDKIVWVFLISALIGDIIETFYCRFVGGVWMSRSSVVFGPFSFVWGLGAVILTISLRGLAQKNDRWVFLGGAVLGGAFEYMCSVFTEIVFGKVFWDYSYMPLNIGGRTNVLFMFFWGILALVWVKIAYPPLDKLIESFPPVPTKVLTWLIVTLMFFNGAFTVAVMLRYNERQLDPEPSNRLETFIDSTYDDDYVSNHWQNMVNAG